MFLNNFSSVRIEKVLFLKKLCFSIFRISYRHSLPTDKQYQCNIMLSLLSQVGHSLPFLRLERFFTESRCAIFTYCCFRVLSNNKKSYCNPKLAFRNVIPLSYFYKTAECHLVDDNKNLEKRQELNF